jgi:hypothetical protein
VSEVIWLDPEVGRGPLGREGLGGVLVG